MDELLAAVAAAIDDMDLDGIEERVQACLRYGIQPEEIIERGISPGLDVVGRKFEEGEYFLGDLVMAGEVVKAGIKPVEAVKKLIQALAPSGRFIIGPVHTHPDMDISKVRIMVDTVRKHGNYPMT